LYRSYGSSFLAASPRFDSQMNMPAEAGTPVAV
jgi:hypothetical protein